MRNPEVTKEKILKQSGTLFNTQGYKATSISDITKATGFTKGAIYRHFKNKSELEMETLSHLSAQMFDQLRGKIKSATTTREKLNAIYNYFGTYMSKPPVKGGCPLMNVAIEADDAHPYLRRRAVTILNMLADSITTILRNGIKYNQVKKDTDVNFYATVIVASLEGAIMMSKLRGDDNDINQVITHLNRQTDQILI